MKKQQKVIYYKSEIDDEFAGDNIQPKKIGDDYSYLGGNGRKLARIFFYHILARPFGYLYMKIRYGHRIVNREVLQNAKGKGYFLYGNHTKADADPLIPQFVDVNRSVYVIVHPNNVSMPVLGHITPSLGALPLPDTITAAKNFINSIKHLSSQGKCVLIYPEAHIWPYYTKIRPFVSASFGYPLQCQTPVYCFTNTYQKRRFFKTPRIVTYVDGPFYAEENLPKAKQKQSLRNQVYEAMVERSKMNNVEMIKYVKEES